MILIGLGANLPGPRGTPRKSCESALLELDRHGIRVVARSRWYRSAPVPPSDQPDYVNGVAAVDSALDPAALLARLHGIEADFGREAPARRARTPGAARPLDLDLIAYHDLVRDGPEPPVLPHPRMAERAFVLLPLLDVAPDWTDPRSGATVRQLIGRLPPHDDVVPLA